MFYSWGIHEKLPGKLDNIFSHAAARHVEQFFAPCHKLVIQVVTAIGDTVVDAYCVPVSVSVVGHHHIIKEVTVRHAEKGENCHVHDKRGFVQTYA